MCVMCFREEDSQDHIFYLCSFYGRVWHEIYSHMGIFNSKVTSPILHFITFKNIMKCKKIRKYEQYLLVSYSIVIYSVRNKIMFKGDMGDVEQTLNNITF